MQLLETVTIFAGGPGSGCHGPNCGRPREHFEEGDRVALNVEKKAFDEKKLFYRKFPVGTEVIVQSSQPPFGMNPEMVTVKSRRMGEVTLPAHELTFLKTGKVTKVDVQPVPKRYIQQQMTLRNGAKYTVIRPEKEHERRGPQDPTKKVSRFKNEFTKLQKIYGVSDKAGRNMKSWMTEATDGTRGVTLFVYRYSDLRGRPKEVIIQEHPWMGEHHRYGTPIQFEYRNAGRAMGLLKARYGISFKLKDWRI